jgi:hypothetical protein
MDRIQPRYVDAGLDGIPAALDDDEIVTVGAPIWDVVKVAVVAPLTLAVEFEDGLAGKVVFKPAHLKGVFAKLENPDYFGQVGIAHGAVTWPGDLDLAPDAMHAEIKKNGEWVLQ